MVQAKFEAEEKMKQDTSRTRWYMTVQKTVTQLVCAVVALAGESALSETEDRDPEVLIYSQSMTSN